MRLLLILLVLLCANVVIFSLVLTSNHDNLHVSFLDVGQGDAILIESPTGTQILVDGGVSRKVLAPLGKEMGLLDRSLDMVVATHPDQDHIGGLPAVFDRYRVSTFMEPGIPHATAATAAVMSAVEDEAVAAHIIARRGMRILLGGGAYVDVLYPDRDVSSMETNSGSVVLHVVYGSTSFMLSGDLPSEQEGWLALLDGEDGHLKSDVLKAGHHGSKNSSSMEWLRVVSPDVVVISAGKDNTYGHPAPETLVRVQQIGVSVYSTLEEGTVRFESDGTKIKKNPGFPRFF